MAVDQIKEKVKLIKAQNKSMVKASLEATKGSKAQYLFIYMDAVDLDLIPEVLPKGVKIILVTKQDPKLPSTKSNIKGVVQVPKLQLGRMGLIKVAVMLALSAKLVKTDDTIVFIGGKSEKGRLDFMLCFSIADESELLKGTDIEKLPKSVKPAVFEHILNLAIELSNKGREGKPVGTIFVLGDEEKVEQLSKQMIINPFKGYSQEERNLLNPNLRDTIFEFSALDGAFVISGDGEVMSAGRYLGAASDEADIPRGLGARHMAAAGITALTNAVALVISESSGDVRIFKNGKVIMNIEKSAR